ncbi:MAG: hypothetical protein HQL76_05315 [Magnetococcales bacterium]|nr:hypothetical protein [Magnetococcales bacterium]
MAGFRGGNRKGINGLIALAVSGGLLASAAPAHADKEDAALILVGFILGGARDLGGDKYNPRRTGLKAMVPRSHSRPEMLPVVLGAAERPALASRDHH